MDSGVGQMNLVVAWFWIILGFVLGLVLGSYFHLDEWLGGYASFKRRLYRLAHVSFFGTAILNLLFYFTVRALPSSVVPLVNIASWGFAVGAISMPACCLLMAHNRKLRTIFVVPVLSLILGGSITFWQVISL